MKNALRRYYVTVTTGRTLGPTHTMTEFCHHWHKSLGPAMSCWRKMRRRFPSAELEIRSCLEGMQLDRLEVPTTEALREAEK